MQESLTPPRPATEATERKFERSVSAPAPWSPSSPSPTTSGPANAAPSFFSPRFAHSDTLTPVIHAHTSEEGTFSFTVPATPPYSPAHSRDSTVASFGKDADPVSALRGRSTPFFMVTAGEGAEKGSNEEGRESGINTSAWQNTLGAWTRGEGIDGSSDLAGSGRRGFKRGESAPTVSFGEQSAAGPAKPAVRPFAHVKQGSEFAHEVNVAQLASLIHALDARLSTITGLSDDLYSRIVLLEDVTRQQGYELDFLRQIVAPHRALYGPQPPVVPQSWSHGSAGTFGQQPMNPLSCYATFRSTSTVPASRLRTKKPMDTAFPPSSRRSSADTGFFLQELQAQQDFDAGMAFKQDIGVGFAQHQDTAGGMGGAGLPRFKYGGAGMERSASFAKFGSGTMAGKGGALGGRQGTMRSRSVSLGAAAQLRPPSLNLDGVAVLGNNPPNYRLLLESDANIDAESFVCRILKHNDQQCSLFLQQKVKSTTPDEMQEIFDAVGKHLCELSFSKFGNFLVSRCLEAGDKQLTQAYEELLTGHFLALSLDPFGCHVLQKLLDCGGAPTKAHVSEELLPHPETLQSRNACHVWNRILTSPNPPTFFRRLAEMGKGLWSDIVKEDGGSLIVQHLIEDWHEAHTSIVAREILERVEDVASTACGALIISYLIDRNALPFCTKIMKHAPTLAMDNCAVTLVDKCIRLGRTAPIGMSGFINEIIKASDSEDPLLLHIASHTNGVQLLVSILTGSTSAREKDKLVRCIKRFEAELMKDGPANGAKLISLCQKTKV
ncbi:pumilio-family RNA binding repeat protein [Rhodotorula toruloides]|uniref:Pumilio-family RNA binding repeat protein n=1 Tax=Rhodotorula toruloides TaxID=5286 RepID=A0A511KNC1_RHOTO|nr:pumilio-family RNA binding repeat protein [Rhodotorula toruloides]